MSIPSSIIKVCSGVLLNNDYLHTIHFDSQSEQMQYFEGKVVKTFSSYTYLRKSWDLTVQASMEEARTWSYLYFKNGNNGKTYFYFINNIEYISEGSVKLFIELDVMQTYHFDYLLHKSFVEREHSASDGIGENIIDEGLELGEFVINQKSNVDMQDLCILILASFNPAMTGDGQTVTYDGGRYDNIYSGLGVYAVDGDKWAIWSDKLKELDSAGISDGIVSMWMYPKDLVALKPGGTWATSGEGISVYSSQTKSITFESPKSLDNYTPRNRKLMSYPFNFLYVSNNCGGAGVYHYEKFSNPNVPNFRVYGSLSPEASTKIVPIGYKGITINYDEGIMGGNYPTCAWNQDVYKLWLAQNQNQRALDMTMAGLKIAGGVAGMVFTGGLGALGGAGAVISGATQIANNIAQKSDKEIQPPQAKGVYSSSINIAAEHQTFTVMMKSVDRTHAQMIDEYFDLYGYKTNRVKIPNRKVRENWTYTKTIGCHVSGNMCTEDIRKIQNVFDNGITFWTDGDKIGSYGLSNKCLLEVNS